MKSLFNRSLNTERLEITPLTPGDSPFILKLLNSEGWLKYIGDRPVNSIPSARQYIKNIIESQTTNYWLVRLKNADTSIGVVTLIKKDYLPSHDIGFAFLPEFMGKGYAYEAARCVLDYVINECNLEEVLAVTIPENDSSITLLKRLNFTH